MRRRRLGLIYGHRDMVAEAEILTDFLPKVQVIDLDCGHWIQQEKPQETTAAILRWVAQRTAAEAPQTCRVSTAGPT